MITRLIVNGLRTLGYDIRKLQDPFAVQKRLIPNPKLIIDGGGHFGETIDKYQELYRNPTIHSYEPTPENHVLLNYKYPLIKIYNEGLFSSNTVKTLLLREHSGTNSLYERPDQGKKYYTDTPIISKEEINLITLDSRYKEIDILKMDIQGAELAALQGAERLLQEQKIKLIYLEVLFIPPHKNADLFDSIMNYLREQGYELFGLYNLYNAPDGQLRYADAIFISNTFRKTISTV